MDVEKKYTSWNFPSFLFRRKLTVRYKNVRTILKTIQVGWPGLCYYWGFIFKLEHVGNNVLVMLFIINPLNPIVI